MLLILVASSNAVLFEVRPTHKRCVAEEFSKGTLVSGNFDVSDKLNRNPSFPNEIITKHFIMDFVVCLYFPS